MCSRASRRCATCRALKPPSANAGTSTWAPSTQLLHHRRDVPRRLVLSATHLATKNGRDPRRIAPVVFLFPLRLPLSRGRGFKVRDLIQRALRARLKDSVSSKILLDSRPNPDPFPSGRGKRTGRSWLLRDSHNPLLSVLESPLLANRLVTALRLDPLHFPLARRLALRLATTAAILPVSFLSRRPTLSAGTISIARMIPSPPDRVVIIGSSFNARCTTRRSRGGIGSSRTLVLALGLLAHRQRHPCNCWRRRARYDSVSSEIGAASLIRRARIRFTRYSSASSVCPCARSESPIRRP